MLLRVLDMVLPVRSGERRLTFALFLHSLCAVGAFLAGRMVRDALFLAHGDKGALAWMYVASAAAVTAAGLLYSPIAARSRRDRVALSTALLFSVLFVLAWFAERTQAPWIYPALYVYVEVIGALCLVQFWTLANELFNAREAKRLYGIIGSGGTFANILVGFAAGKLATRLGASSLLWLCALLLMGAGAASYVAGRLGNQRLFARAASGKVTHRSGGAARVLSSGHLRAVALLAAVTFFTTTLVDYEFKVIAAGTYSKDELAAYFGYFNAVVGLLALGLQLFGTSRVLNRVGVIGALAVLPLSLAGGNLGLALLPGLLMASFAKGADTLFRYSINDATTQILYLPVPAQARASAKAFIDGVVKPLAIGLCGVMLAGYRSFLGGDPYRIAWVALALSTAWAVVVFGLRGKYIRSLQDNLRNRRLDLASARYKVLDASTHTVLVRALESQDRREVLNALELLPQLETLQLDHRVEALLDHAEPEIRIAALEYYARRQAMRYANSIFRRFDDPDPRVRAAAVNAFCAIGRDKAVRSVRPFLVDPDPAIRGAAVTGMIRYGGLDGVLVAAGALKELINHSEARMRQHAARVLGAIGVKNFYQPVLQLMNDPELSVRRQAIQAAGVLKSPEFVLPLIYKTQTVETLHDSVEALSAFGPAIGPTLGKVLSNRLEQAPIRRAVARVLGRMAAQEAVEIITRHLQEPDEELRTRLYRALAKAVKGQRLQLADRRQVDAALAAELLKAYRALSAAEALKLDQGPGPSTPRSGAAAARALLASAVNEKLSQTEYRIFLLLAVLYPDADMERIYAGISEAGATDAIRKRANAVELLDNLLDRGLKRKLLPLLEDAPRAHRLRTMGEELAVGTEAEASPLFELCQDETAWVRACALWCAAQEQPTVASDLLIAGLADPSPVVRELCLVACVQAVPERVVALAEAKLTDEAPVVRRRAALLATQRRAGAAH